MFLPMNRAMAPVPVNSLYPASTRSPQETSGIFSDLMHGSTGSPMFMQPSPASTGSTPYAGAASSTGVNSFPSNYAGMPPMTMNTETSTGPNPFPTSTNGSNAASQQAANTPPDPVEEDDDPKRNEAMKLVKYVISKLSLRLSNDWSRSATTLIITQETPPIACPPRFDLLRCKGRVLLYLYISCLHHP